MRYILLHILNIIWNILARPVLIVMFALYYTYLILYICLLRPITGKGGYAVVTWNVKELFYR